jgi:hypothetical protein
VAELLQGRGWYWLLVDWLVRDEDKKGVWEDTTRYQESSIHRASLNVARLLCTKLDPGSNQNIIFLGHLFFTYYFELLSPYMISYLGCSINIYYS